MVGVQLSALSYSVLAQLLNELRSFMRTSIFRTDSIPALPGVLCLLIATALAGCASKNPLIDDPVPSAASSVKPLETPQKTQSAATDSSGVVTTGPSGIRRFLGILAPYRIDIQQGNFVSREMVAQLREGMERPEGVTRDQVRFVLGTPLLTDMFHADRWDYIFYLKKRSGEIISSRVTVFFKDNRVADIDGSTLPTEQEYLTLIAGTAPDAAQDK